MSTEDTRGRNAVRDLARQIAEIANSNENRAKTRRWSDVNSLRFPDRPPIMVRPGRPAWQELLPRENVVSEDPSLEGIEYSFRQRLFKWDLDDDDPIETAVAVPAVMRLESGHLWGFQVRHIDREHDDIGRTAWAYDPPMKEESDLDRIVLPRYHYDEEATQRNLQRMGDLLGDILPVEQTCAVPGPGAWLHGWATQLRGVEQLLLDMMDRPEWTHRLMRTLMKGWLSVHDQFEAFGLLTPNNAGFFACDDLPQDDFVGRIRLRDCWGRGESQEFEAVSPAQHDEFLLQYQKPILERWGLTHYGCCENLTNKIDLILSIPNLRRFICSAWTDIERLSAALGDRYCIEWRQKATDVAFAPDLTQVEEHLESGLRAAQGTPTMIVLQELETVNGNLRRLHDWTALAREVGMRCAA